MESATRGLEALERLKRELRRSDRELRRIAGKQRQLRETIATIARSAPTLDAAYRADRGNCMGAHRALQGASER
jgi:hypothetical protein